MKKVLVQTCAEFEIPDEEYQKIVNNEDGCLAPMIKRINDKNSGDIMAVYNIELHEPIWEN